LRPDDSPAITRDVAPDGYAVFHIFRDVSQPDGLTCVGGLAVIARDGIKIRPHSLASPFCPTHFELQLVRLGPDSTPIAIANIYRRPSSTGRPNPIPEFLDGLADFLSSFAAGAVDRLLICGDVNCPGLVGTSTIDTELTATQSCHESFGHSQHVQTPTRANSILDIIADISPSLATGIAVVEVGDISDHHLVVAELMV
jgi:hypothetical protein